jgi:hypothetical protein
MKYKKKKDEQDQVENIRLRLLQLPPLPSLPGCYSDFFYLEKKAVEKLDDFVFTNHH